MTGRFFLNTQHRLRRQQWVHRLLNDREPLIRRGIALDLRDGPPRCPPVRLATVRVFRDSLPPFELAHQGGVEDLALVHRVGVSLIEPKVTGRAAPGRVAIVCSARFRLAVLTPVGVACHRRGRVPIAHGGYQQQAWHHLGQLQQSRAPARPGLRRWARRCACVRAATGGRTDWGRDARRARQFLPGASPLQRRLAAQPNALSLPAKGRALQAGGAPQPGACGRGVRSSCSGCGHWACVTVASKLPEKYRLSR